jgi:potassium-transporting ATPase KdpC subunit
MIHKQLRKHLRISILFTAVSTLLLGVLYPLAATAFAHLLLHRQADGSLITQGGKIIGSRLIGQSFTGARYFHGRPSAAGNGYDATSSGGSNLAESSAKLVARIDGDVARMRRSDQDVPVDLVTASGSGLDPDITLDAALFELPSVAKARGIGEEQLRTIVMANLEPRVFGLLGEPRVNVLELNLALDQTQPRP